MRFGWKWNNICNRERIKLTSENMVSNTDLNTNMINSVFFTWGFTKCDSEKWTHIEMLINSRFFYVKIYFTSFYVYDWAFYNKEHCIELMIGFCSFEIIDKAFLKNGHNFFLLYCIYFLREKQKYTLFLLVVWLLIKHVKTQLSFFCVIFDTRWRKYVWFDIIL